MATTEQIQKYNQKLQKRGLTSDLVTIVHAHDEGIVNASDGNDYRRFTYVAFDITGNKGENGRIWMNELIKINDRTTNVIADRQNLIKQLDSKQVKSVWYSAQLSQFNANGYNVNGMWNKQDAQLRAQARKQVAAPASTPSITDVDVDALPEF